jgi:hypothetical protein
MGALHIQFGDRIINLPGRPAISAHKTPNVTFICRNISHTQTTFRKIKKTRAEEVVKQIIQRMAAKNL